jgi:hypothetical protein
MSPSSKVGYVFLSAGAGKALRTSPHPPVCRTPNCSSTAESNAIEYFKNWNHPCERPGSRPRRVQNILDGTRWEMIDAAPTEIEDPVREAIAPIVFYNHDHSDCWRKMIRTLMKMRRSVCVVLLSNETDAPLSDEVVRCGGFDVLTRPLRREQVLPLLLFAYSYCRGYGPYLSRARRVSSSS